MSAARADVCCRRRAVGNCRAAGAHPHMGSDAPPPKPSLPAFALAVLPERWRCASLANQRPVHRPAAMQAFLKWFGPTPGPGQHKFTLDELRELYGILIKNPVVTEANRAIVVETIRAIAEFMIWGDQNEPRIFDFFLEHNIMTYLHRILLQPANRSGDVAKQVLQTLSIIIQNVKSETAVFFLFSNNHINNIVDLDFDFEDEEVLGYYVSFLKTISLKLNVGTVQFFFDTTGKQPQAGAHAGPLHLHALVAWHSGLPPPARLVNAPGWRRPHGRRCSAACIPPTHPGANPPAAGSDTVAFPLYTRAIRLAHHREGMVRAAVRTLTLNVFSVDVPEIQSFVTSPPSDRFFLEVAAYLREQVQLLDRRLAAAEGGSVQALGSLDSALAEVEDVLSYCSDALGLGERHAHALRLCAAPCTSCIAQLCCCVDQLRCSCCRRRFSHRWSTLACRRVLHCPPAGGEPVERGGGAGAAARSHGAGSHISSNSRSTAGGARHSWPAPAPVQLGEHQEPLCQRRGRRQRQPPHRRVNGACAAHPPRVCAVCVRAALPAGVLWAPAASGAAGAGS